MSSLELLALWHIVFPMLLRFTPSRKQRGFASRNISFHSDSPFSFWRLILQIRQALRPERNEADVVIKAAEVGAP